MAVSFTANIALAKPDTNELGEEWVNGAQLASDNNAILLNKTNIPVVAYTPVIVGQTTSPSLGVGTIKGEYVQVQNFVVGTFSMEFLDPGVTVGSGEYGFSLPFPVDGVFHTVGTALNNSTGTNSCIGEGFTWDNTAVANCGTVAIDAVTVAGVSYARLVTEAIAGKTSRVFRDSMPFALADADKFTCNFFYRKA